MRNYCIIIMGDTIGCEMEISKVSAINPNILNAKGIVIATIKSKFSPKELSDWFMNCNRNFMVFDLDKDNSAYHFMKYDIHNSLFGFIGNDDDELSTSESNKPKKVKNKGLLTVEEISKLTSAEKNELLNWLIDEGLDNLSDDDKKMLQLLIDND